MLSIRLRTSIVSILLFLLGVSCASSTILSAPTETVVPPSETSTLVPVPTDSPTATVVTQALFCVWDTTPTPGSSQCALPTGNQRDQFCVNKVPYTLIAIPPDDTYHVLTAGFTCDDAGVRNNFQLLTCTGPQSYTFNLKVCNAACAALPATATAVPSGRCPSGYDYLSDKQCCQTATNDQSGCVTLSFDTRSCGQTDCSQFSTSSSCNSHNVCKWIVPTKASVLPYCTSR